MHIGWRRGALILAGLVSAGFLFAWSGLFNPAASSGHWAVTDWFLHWALRNAVRTQALFIETPPLDDPSLRLAGAAHYESGCAPCHGSPAEPRPAFALMMTPPPPLLAPRIRAWREAELFWIVKHGIKFTGMPAWPSQLRDDEVWAVVAFLRTLPEQTPDDYRLFVEGPRADQSATANGSAAAPGTRPEAVDPPGDPRSGPAPSLIGAIAHCARCHGADGQGRGGTVVPAIAGQSEAYILASLEAYASGRRASGMMALAAGLSEPVLFPALAAHFAGLSPPVPSGEPADGAVLARGRAIAETGVSGDAVPACLACHGGDGRNPIYPRLDGLSAGYLERQLALFASGERGGTAFAHLMTTVARRLSEDDRRAVALYLAARDPRAEAR